MFFVSFVLPVLLGYFAMAVLTVTPHTHAVRLALLPIVALCALRAAVSVDMSPGNPDRKSRNLLFVISMVIITVRTLEWSSNKPPLVRHLHPSNSSRCIVADALDLATTLRGYGWEWSRGVYIPRETRPTNRIGFILYVFLSAIFHSLIFDLSRISIQSFSPTGIGAPSGGSIFDDTLPFYVRHFRASVISILTVIAVYAAVQMCYDGCTLVGVFVFRQDPTRWPPAFDAPWRATSLRDFWGCRWHQFLRHAFVTCGGYPLSLVLGKPGLIIGTFLLSGLYHHAGVVMLDDGAEPWRMFVGFGMMAPGILAEWVFKIYTGRKVGGVIGWVWTAGWLLLWGNVIVDGLAGSGLFGHYEFMGILVPGQKVVRGLVTNFDAWLHLTQG